MLYDRLAGQPLEHQHLTGEVVRRANALGIPVPLNAALLALLEALDRGRTMAAPDVADGLGADLPPALEGPAEGELVGVLEVATDRQPAGDAGHLYGQWP